MQPEFLHFCFIHFAGPVFSDLLFMLASSSTTKSGRLGDCCSPVPLVCDFIMLTCNPDAVPGSVP
jgi:hypothetical protein